MCSREVFFAALGHLPSAVALLIGLRWPEGPQCPHCGSKRIGGHGRYHRNPDVPRMRCKACRRTFLPTTGTPLARSRVSLCVWVVVAWLVCLGHSARRCAVETKAKALRYARVYALVWRLREAAIGYEHGRRLSGVVEGDEFYVSCGHKGEVCDQAPAEEGEPVREGRHRGLKHGPGRGQANKDRPVVFVQVQRDGPVIFEVRGNADQATVGALYEQTVEKGSTVYTDSASCYEVLGRNGYTLEQVNHSEKEYARGEVHENRAETEIRLLQHFLAEHQGVALQNLASYLKLHQFRRNHRKQAAWEQAALLLAGLLGNGPSPLCLVRPAWAHSLGKCQVGRFPVAA